MGHDWLSGLCLLAIVAVFAYVLIWTGEVAINARERTTQK